MPHTHRMPARRPRRCVPMGLCGLVLAVWMTQVRIAPAVIMHGNPAVVVGQRMGGLIASLGCAQARQDAAPLP